MLIAYRKNFIRNSAGIGAVAGTPGTLPTNWSVFTALTGITRTVVGVATDSGIDCIDIQLTGTPSAAGDWFFNIDAFTAAPAANGQTWTGSLFHKLAAGSLTGIDIADITISPRDGAGSAIGAFAQVFTPSAPLTRTQATGTFNVASTAYALTYLRLHFTGAAINATLRIGWPQIERGTSATSPIRTTGAAVTRGMVLK